jgi:DNA replication and repair protein RecF
VRLAHLSLSHFRNLNRLETDLPAGLTLVSGANAQGKSSLLEAIHYLSAGSSSQADSDRQLIRFDAPDRVARVAGQVERATDSLQLEIRLALEANSDGEQRLRREVLINGVKSRLSALYGQFQAVLFLPQDLRVVEGPPGERRRLLDEALSQAVPRYARDLSEYGRVLTQRNALLRSLQERRGDGRQLEFWDERLSRLGAGLMRARAAAVLELQELAAPIHLELSRGREALRLEYLPAYDPFAAEQRVGHGAVPAWRELTGEDIRAGLAEALRQGRAEELGRGMTLLGPHRDELAFRANQIDLRTFGSRGQSRTAVLALKLAEVEWLRRRSGEHPVLLLDEVLAELDPQRRQDLLARVLSAEQVVLTAADLSLFEAGFLERATLWRIESGQLAAV